MKRKILIVGLVLLVIFTIGSLSASENIIQDNSTNSNEILLQNDVSDFQKSKIDEESETIQSAENQDVILQSNANQDNESLKVALNQDEEILGKSQEKTVSTPGYLAESNVWFQNFDLIEQDGNMWIINDNGKAFPKDSYIKIVAKEKGSSYKAQDSMSISEVFPERGMDNIHYYIVLREFTKIQFKSSKYYKLKVYFVSSGGKSHLLGKKTAKIKLNTKKFSVHRDRDVYFFYRYWKNNPLGEPKVKVFKTHPNDNEKIRIIIYKKNGKFFANKKVKYELKGKMFNAKTNSRGVLLITSPKKTGSYRYQIYASKGTFVFNVKVTHSVSIPKVTIKKSAKKVVIPLQLKKINGKFYKNKKITFKLDNKTYNLKTNKKGIAKVTIKKPVLNKLKVSQNVKLTATYKNDTATAKVKVRK